MAMTDSEDDNPLGAIDLSRVYRESALGLLYEFERALSIDRDRAAAPAWARRFCDRELAAVRREIRLREASS